MRHACLPAQSLSVRGEWSGVSALASQQLSASSVHPTLQTRWRALAALAEWQQGQGQAALQWLAPMLPLQPEHWPQQVRNMMTTHPPASQPANRKLASGHSVGADWPARPG